MVSGDAALSGEVCCLRLEVHAPVPASDPAAWRQMQESVCVQKSVFLCDVFLIPLRAAVQAMP